MGTRATWFVGALVPLAAAAIAGCGGSSGSSGSAATATPAATVSNTYAFANVGPLDKARAHHTATLLADGRILVAGGQVGPTAATEEVVLFDPATGTVSPAAPMSEPRMHHAAVLLPTRKVLVVGGQRDRFGPALRTTELYDPASDSWTPGPDLAVERTEAFVTTYEGGKKVLIAGGATFGAGGAIVVHDSAEVYNADANTLASTATAMDSPRCCGEAVLQSNGQILLVSGYRAVATAEPAPAALYDPATDAFTATAVDVSRAAAAVAERSDGTHAIAGVDSASATLSDARRFDGQTWLAAGGTLAPRAHHTASTLGNDEVVLIGGRDGAAILSSIQLYPSGIAPTGSGTALIDARYDHTATLVADRVYVIGGLGDNDDLLASIEVYAADAGLVPGAGAARGNRVPTGVITPPPPTGGLTVAALTPNAGDVGDTVVVTGAGFDAAPANNVLAFNGVQAVVTSADTSNPSANTLTCLVPAGATTGPVTVEVAGTLVTGPVFTVGGSPTPTGPPPRILFVLPSSGRQFFPVSITGQYFGSNPIVTFNGTPTINIINWSSNNVPIIGNVSELVVIVPPGATTGPLVVENNGQQSNPYHFTVR